MALDSELGALITAIGRLHEALVRDARVIVLEDRPRPKAEPIDRLCDAFVDVLGWLKGLQEAAAAAARAAAHPGDLYHAGRALGDCQARFNRLSAVFTFELTSWERVALVRRFCTEHGSEWRAWWKEAAVSIQACREPIDGVERALLACWQELTDRLGAGGLSVHAQVGHPLTVHEVSQENER